MERAAYCHQLSHLDPNEQHKLLPFNFLEFRKGRWAKINCQGKGKNHGHTTRTNQHPDHKLITRLLSQTHLYVLP